MAVLLVEIHQIYEQQATLEFIQRGQRLRHTIGVALGLFVLADAASQENVKDLADAEDLHLAIVKLIEQHACGRRNGIVLAVWRACKLSGLANKWTGDHAAHLERPAQKLTRNF